MSVATHDTLTTADRPLGPAVGALDEVTHTQVEEFLYLEAELLDDWDLDTWALLYSDDSRYIVPCNDIPDGDPARDLMLIDDDALRLRLRVQRLNSRKAHREFPHSTTSHQVTNVRLRPVEGDELPVVAEFTVWRFRDERSVPYVGRYHYRLRATDGRLRIVSKRVVLALTTLHNAFDVSIIL